MALGLAVEGFAVFGLVLSCADRRRSGLIGVIGDILNEKLIDLDLYD